MRSMMTTLGIAVALASAGAWAAENDDTYKQDGSEVRRDADHTAVNKRDRDDDQTLTADEQPNDESDRALVAAVRRGIVDKNELSTQAHNVKIIAKDGVVTLRGPVKSTDERSRIETIAREVAGVARVRNELDVETR